jgi:hypothetical protein
LSEILVKSLATLLALSGSPPDLTPVDLPLSPVLRHNGYHAASSRLGRAEPT